MDDSDIPEADRAPGAPHPRHSTRLFGQTNAEQGFLTAFNAGRLHHGWLLTGPRGVGKATLAWRIARFLLATPPDQTDSLFGTPPPPETLDIAPDHPVTRRIEALSDPGLFLLRRAWDDKARPQRLKTVITVDEVRKLGGFFHLSAAEGGRRVVIVDAADEMNTNAANALLKLLEEPPAGATLLLIAHQPAAILPTIRSRCRELRLAPLAPEPLADALAATGTHSDDPAALAELSGGSVGEAIRLTALDGLALYSEIVALMASLPRLDRPRLLALANSVTGRAQEARFDLTLRLIDLFLTRLARSGAGAPPATAAAPQEIETLHKLCPDALAARKWAALSAEVNARLRHGRAVNLDPAALLLDTVFSIDATASKLAAAQAPA